jgi:hypothetical protein
VSGPFVLLADHVEVSLEEGSGERFAAGVGGFADDKIAGMILNGFEMGMVRDRADVFAGGGFFGGGAGNGGESVKVLPEGFGLQVGERRGHVVLRECGGSSE